MVDLEGRGIPAVYIATVEFSDAGAGQSKALGADQSAIFVEHPIQDRTDDEMRIIADKALDAVLAALVES